MFVKIYLNIKKDLGGEINIAVLAFITADVYVCSWRT